MRDTPVSETAEDHAMFAHWNELPDNVQVGLAREALSRAVAMIAMQAEVLADEIESGCLADRGGPDALRLFAAVMRVDGADELAPAGHA
jgi:Mor family transcriptional regulator